ncbi:PAS domain-containing protein [Sphingomonas donggukensis]|uniref:histidine kinase n=1 Tax=Sphingomonas donggukensis TaxID=2949093 RepID=A0ABY4TTT7_9SPHN|nr:PAS domain-containing protein [Sphingomonas donggukensis]URW75818.1 PAS domain-containing protein [Sphingomonas donggukensis]
MALRFLDHGGAMGRMIRDHDWSATPLGPIEGWPATLRTMLGVCLASSLPTCIYWGPELRLLYNDAWAPIPGERHPACLGQPAAEVWYDIWDVVGPQFADVLASGDGHASYDQRMAFVRGGVTTESYWNYSFTPIRDESGDAVGVFNQGNETTRVVMAERAQAAEIDRLRDMFDQAPFAFALLQGPDFVIGQANDLYRDLVGARDIIGRRVVDALPEVEKQGFIDLLRTVYDTGRAYRADGAEITLNRLDDGASDTRYLDFVYQPIRDAGGAVTAILALIRDVTDRAQAERALRESEERLSLALDSSLGIGTWDWDVTHDRVTADARFAALYRVDPAIAAAGAPVATFFAGIHPDDHPRVRAAIDATLATGVPFAEEYRLVRPGKPPIWVTAQGRARFDETGVAVRFPGITFDITKRHEAEEAARVAATDLQIATETQSFIFRLAERMRSLDSPAAILRLTTSTLGRRLACDRVGFYRLLSDDIAQFLYCWHSDRLPPLTGTLPLAEFGPANLTRYHAGETLAFPDYSRDATLRGTRIGQLSGAGVGVPLHRGGHWAACLFVNNATPRPWSADEIALIEAVAEVTWDAVERANAVTALRESEEKFRAIANSIDQMVWSTQPDGFHDYYNERWYEYTGVPHGSTDGTGWNDMFHPDDQERAWALWRQCLDTGEPYRIEYRLRHNSGQYRWVLGSAQPVRDDQGRITRWFGTCTDIQEIVEARDVLTRSRAELEAAIDERTQQLMVAEEQLRQAQKMEALGQLTGGIAHDFNNMLAVVIGALDLLERRIAAGRTDVARYVEAAKDGANRAAQLTQRLLGFSRQTALAPAVIDANEMVCGMTDLLGRTIGESIAIETQLEPALWLAIVDRSQLENAIVNLAVNARDAMPRGGRLTVTTSNCSLAQEDARPRGVAPGDYVSLAVADTGSGMVAEVAEKAFDPFFTTKDVGKGTGLGLSQVFGFVRQSGGHVTIETAPGEGTTVTMLLPRDSSGHAPSPSPVVASIEHRGRPDEVVLVVEDEDRVRNFSVEALRELGYGVIHANDGPDALAMIDAGQRISLLFTDVVMPGMTGRELADAARERVPGLRVLYTSGYTRDAVERGGADGLDLVRKPFDVRTLAARIRSALDV